MTSLLKRPHNRVYALAIVLTIVSRCQIKTCHLVSIVTAYTQAMWFQYYDGLIRSFITIFLCIHLEFCIQFLAVYSLKYIRLLVVFFRESVLIKIIFLSLVVMIVVYWFINRFYGRALTEL